MYVRNWRSIESVILLVFIELSEPMIVPIETKDKRVNAMIKGAVRKYVTLVGGQQREQREVQLQHHHFDMRGKEDIAHFEDRENNNDENNDTYQGE